LYTDKKENSNVILINCQVIAVGIIHPLSRVRSCH